MNGKKTFVYTAGSMLSAARVSHHEEGPTTLWTLCIVFIISALWRTRDSEELQFAWSHMAPPLTWSLLYLSVWIGKPLWRHAFQASLSQRKAIMTIPFGSVLFLCSPLPPAHPICHCPSKSGCTETSKLLSHNRLRRGWLGATGGEATGRILFQPSAK